MYCRSTGHKDNKCSLLLTASPTWKEVSSERTARSVERRAVQRGSNGRRSRLPLVVQEASGLSAGCATNPALFEVHRRRQPSFRRALLQRAALVLVSFPGRRSGHRRGQEPSRCTVSRAKTKRSETNDNDFYSACGLAGGGQFETLGNLGAAAASKERFRLEAVIDYRISHHWPLKKLNSRYRLLVATHRACVRERNRRTINSVPR